MFLIFLLSNNEALKDNINVEKHERIPLKKIFRGGENSLIKIFFIPEVRSVLNVILIYIIFTLNGKPQSRTVI